MHFHVVDCLYVGVSCIRYSLCGVCVCQAEDGIRDLVRSRGLGDVYKRQLNSLMVGADQLSGSIASATWHAMLADRRSDAYQICLLYTSDAADERSSVDLGGRRIIKKKKQDAHDEHCNKHTNKTQI